MNERVSCRRSRKALLLRHGPEPRSKQGRSVHGLASTPHRALGRVGKATGRRSIVGLPARSGQAARSPRRHRRYLTSERRRRRRTIWAAPQPPDQGRGRGPPSAGTPPRHGGARTPSCDLRRAYTVVERARRRTRRRILAKLGGTHAKEFSKVQSRGRRAQLLDGIDRVTPRCSGTRMSGHESTRRRVSPRWRQGPKALMSAAIAQARWHDPSRDRGSSPGPSPLIGVGERHATRSSNGRR